MKILISRTDNIGDVVLTLPMAGAIKKHAPHSEIFFLGKTYTAPVVKLSKNIDGFLNWSELESQSDHSIARKLKTFGFDAIIHVFPTPRLARIGFLANIPQRVGTSRRWYHWPFCNRRVSFSRHKSDAHEAQLNLKLLSGLGLPSEFLVNDLPELYGTVPPEYDPIVKQFLDPSKFNLILHPLSFGSALEWGHERFLELASIIDHQKFNIIISGTQKESDQLRQNLLVPLKNKVRDATGKLSLDQFLCLIDQADGLIAASTGPLHMASFLGKNALGLYSCRRPIHPGRWSPIGIRAQFLSTKQDEDALSSIKASEVLKVIEDWKK